MIDLLFFGAADKVRCTGKNKPKIQANMAQNAHYYMKNQNDCFPVCGMGDMEKLSEKQTRNLLSYYSMRLQFICKDLIINKGDMTDVISKINELSLHLRTFID